MKLFGFFLSSAAYRVRIALNLKNIDYEQLSLKLREGEHKQADYLAVNPQGLVPALALSGAASDTVLFQSMAILEYLEEVYPDPPLLPDHPVRRARCRAVADNIACDIHPLNNLRVMLYLKDELGHDDDEINTWYHHWLKAGFDGVERSIGADPYLLRRHRHPCRCLPPAAALQRAPLQVRSGALSQDPRRRRGVSCADAFDKAYPDNQPDAV